MTTQAGVTREHHSRAVRFFWGLLIGATLVSLVGNVAHAVLPYLPHLVVQIGAGAVPPIALLVAVHGIALAVRAGASGRVYCWAIGAVAVIGIGAFTVSFLALRDLMQAIGYSPATACFFPAIIDTTVAVSTLMLVALGDKPARRARTVNTPGNAQIPIAQRSVQPQAYGTKAVLRAHNASGGKLPARASSQRRPAQPVQGSARTEGTQGDPETAQADADYAAKLIASGVTTQPAETVIAVLEAHRRGASINAAAKAPGINFRTAQRILERGAELHQRQLVAIG